MGKRRSPVRWEVVGTRFDTHHRIAIIDLGQRQTAARGPVPKRSAELQAQFDETTGRPIWVRLWHEGGLAATELQRFPWRSFLVIAEAAQRGLVEPTFDGAGNVTNRNDSLLAFLEAGEHLSDLMEDQAAGRRVRRRNPKITKRPGRGGHPDAHYRAVAERYKELRTKGASNPTATIGRERHVSRDTAAGWVRGARKRGHLPPARPGRAG